MNAIDRVIDRKNKAYNCFANYKNGSNAKEYQQFIDIFLPMLFQKNNNRLEISVGKKISESEFLSYLSVVTHNFIVIPSIYNNESQLIIRDSVKHYIYTLINISLIEDLHIEKEGESSDYRIWFHHDELDYMMRITNEE